MHKIIDIISHYLLVGFVLATPVFSLLYLIRKDKRELIYHFFERSNALIILTSVVVIYDFIVNDLMRFEFESQYEYYAYVNRLYGPYWFVYWGPVIIKGLLPQFFWIKKIREKIIPALVLVVLLLLSFYMPIFQSTHTEYLPSNWSFNFKGIELFFTFLLYVFFIMGRDINMLWK